MRKGCPLASLVFALIKKPPLHQLDDELIVSTLKNMPPLDNAIHCDLMFTNDNANMLLAEDENIDQLVKINKEFFEVIGFKVNTSKTKAM